MLAGDQPESEGGEQSVAREITISAFARDAGRRATARVEIGDHMARGVQHTRVRIDDQSALRVSQAAGDRRPIERRCQRFAERLAAEAIAAFAYACVIGFDRCAQPYRIDLEHFGQRFERIGLAQSACGDRIAEMVRWRQDIVDPLIEDADADATRLVQQHGSELGVALVFPVESLALHVHDDRAEERHLRHEPGAITGAEITMSLVCAHVSSLRAECARPANAVAGVALCADVFDADHLRDMSAQHRLVGAEPVGCEDHLFRADTLRAVGTSEYADHGTVAVGDQTCAGRAVGQGEVGARCERLAQRLRKTGAGASRRIVQAQRRLAGTVAHEIELERQPDLVDEHVDYPHCRVAQREHDRAVSAAVVLAQDVVGHLLG